MTQRLTAEERSREFRRLLELGDTIRTKLRSGTPLENEEIEYVIRCTAVDAGCFLRDTHPKEAFELGQQAAEYFAEKKGKKDASGL